MAECNAPVFLQKSMGSDDVGYLYDNSRIYGRKVYFRAFITSIAHAYLNSHPSQ